MSDSLPSRRPFWLIARCRDGGLLEVCTIASGGGSEMLPIFGFEEEAEVFLRFEPLGKGWQARRTPVGELVLVLRGPCAKVERVALDPPPGIVCDGTVGLVSLRRKDFLRNLLLEDGRGPHRSFEAACARAARSHRTAGNRWGRTL